ncbi:multidrug ABC transporter ATP-binding protein [Thiocapsa imhoffii]|uniref:Multidrug ABC transporter ATP-binding protein n=1 Tax=Thiocapsa imhoffii TaxID=382777 RepID=A0A9X0WIU5_9GAMM|nr:ATP-binding cassette domain-containing protein [Thiocapsa imhoffii]MBK1645341.1 multidrug ABC transporter ATP-binding protein [Thiocapsa imhoffii]
MIEVRELSRCYGDLKAVQAVSFNIARGEIVGLLGHNGAGKTTIMKMLTGYLEPSSGEIRIDGLDIAERRREAQRRIGYLPENCPLYPEMQVVDYLNYQATLHGLAPARRAAAIRRAIERTDLRPKATALIGTLSRGYRQRVGVAQAILHEPAFLILDEPTNGLDPGQIQQMRALVRELAKEATLIISTHVLQEVEAVCTRVLIMRGGELALDSALNAIGRPRRLLVTLAADTEAARSVLGALPTVTHIEVLAGDGNLCDLALSAEDPHALAPVVASTAAEHAWSLHRLSPERRDLEDLFGAVTLETMETHHA